MNVDLYSEIDTAVTTTITNALVTLTELKSVQSQLYPDISALADSLLPAASVCEWGETATWEGSDNTGSALWVGVLVCIIDKIGETTTPHANKSVYLKIQKAIVDLFRTPLSGTYSLGSVTEVKRCVIAPSVFIDRRLPGFQHVMSMVGLRFWCPEEGV